MPTGIYVHNTANTIKHAAFSCEHFRIKTPKAAFWAARRIMKRISVSALSAVNAIATIGAELVFESFHAKQECSSKCHQ